MYVAGIINFFGPKWLDAISQAPKKSQFPGPNPLPLALIMDAARIKIITHGANTYITGA